MVGLDSGGSGGLESSHGDSMGSLSNTESLLDLSSMGVGLSSSSDSSHVVSMSFLLSSNSSGIGLLGSSESVSPDVSLVEGMSSLLVGNSSLSSPVLEGVMSLANVMLSSSLLSSPVCLVSNGFLEVMGL